MKRSQIGISFLALAAMTAQASAAALCDQGSAAALKTAAVQQELMVAGLTCHADAAYNRFVIADRPELQKSDAALMAYFKSRDGNEAGYDSYKTKLANLAASTSAGSNRFCSDTARVFKASEGLSLQDFVAGQHLLIAAPEACAVKYDRVEEAAVAGPSYALPATPYGAANLAAALPNTPPSAQARTYRYNDLDQRQAYNAPPSRPARRQENDYQGWTYGPYGWLPPRPARRRGWYGYDDEAGRQ